jgi:hypothetical protein
MLTVQCVYAMYSQTKEAAVLAKFGVRSADTKVLVQSGRWMCVMWACKMGCAVTSLLCVRVLCACTH